MPFIAHVLQYMRPNGPQVPQTIELSVELAEAYMDMDQHGFRLEAEVLGTGEVSVSIDREDDYQDLIICPNGPEVLKAIETMLLRRRWNEPQEQPEEDE